MISNIFSKEAEQALTNQLRSEYAEMVTAYEARLKQPTSFSIIIDHEIDRK